MAEDTNSQQEKFQVIIKIAERAENEQLLRGDKLSLIMDLEYAAEGFDLRLYDLLNANQVDFAHDICGIQSKFNRQTKKMENCFLPRFAG